MTTQIQMEASRQNARLAAYVTNRIKMYKREYGMPLDEARVAARLDKEQMLRAGNDLRKLPFKKKKEKVETMIWEACSKKLIPVKPLREVFSAQHPNFSFFVHRNLSPEGKNLFSEKYWNVSERLTGMTIVSKRDKMSKAISDGLSILSNVSPERMRNAVNSSLITQGRKELCLK